jgi:glycerophosphoryl diester phosphodiesterase
LQTSVSEQIPLENRNFIAGKPRIRWRKFALLFTEEIFMTRICAHAGFDRTAANSLSSIMKAVEKKYDMIEIDINRHGEKIILSHDAKDIYTKEPPLLKDCLEYLKGKNIQINCDVKDKSLLEEVVKNMAYFGMLESCFFTGNTLCNFNDNTRHKFFVSPGFDPLPCEDLLKKSNYIITAEIADAFVKLFKSSKNKNFIGFNFDYRCLNRDAFDILTANRVSFICWTVNDKALIEDYINRGIYTITTDCAEYAKYYRNIKIEKNDGNTF